MHLTPGTYRSRWSAKAWISLLLASILALAAITNALAVSVSGSVEPASIEIDHGAGVGANLYPGAAADAGCSALPVTLGTLSIDWIKDCAANTDTPSVTDSIATGINTNATTSSLIQSGAAATGHWNGARIVDGLNQGDQDIFLTGGKEELPNQWNVGPGSVGSAKYDFGQAYLANNNTNLYFGMERSGNNGDTAFDFEFNRLAPHPDLASGCLDTTHPASCPNVSVRSDGDVLITFLLTSSNGGQAAINYFTYSSADNTYHLQATPGGSDSSINLVPVTAAPWGYIDSHGKWTTSGGIPALEFAEASVPLSALHVSPCGGKAYVQVRTRSSTTDNSDLKDASKIFEYNFSSLSAQAAKTAAADDASGITLGGNALLGTTDITSNSSVSLQWQFENPAGTWNNLAGANSPTLSYSAASLENNALTTTTGLQFSVGSVNYKGIQYTDHVRLHVSYLTCAADSDAVTVTRIKANDP